MEVLRDQILEHCLVAGNHSFDGMVANNKLNFGLAEGVPELADAITDRLVSNIKPFSPQVLVGISEDAPYWVDRVADELHIPAIYLSSRPLRDLGIERIQLRSSWDHWYTETHPNRRLVAIQTTGYEVRRAQQAMQVPYLGNNALALVGIWQRNPEVASSSSMSWVIKERIPRYLLKKSVLWQEFIDQPIASTS